MLFSPRISGQPRRQPAFVIETSTVERVRGWEPARPISWDIPPVAFCMLSWDWRYIALLQVQTDSCASADHASFSWSLNRRCARHTMGGKTWYGTRRRFLKLMTSRDIGFTACSSDKDLQLPRFLHYTVDSRHKARMRLGRRSWTLSIDQLKQSLIKTSKRMCVAVHVVLLYPQFMGGRWGHF